MIATAGKRKQNSGLKETFNEGKEDHQTLRKMLWL